MTTERRLAKALGWFSIGLGVAQVVAPKQFAGAIGAHDNDRAQLLTRLVGMRELAAGAGILTQRRPAPWLWARVAGDAMDLALLGAVLRSKRADETRLAIAAAGVAGVLVVDALCGRELSRHRNAKGTGSQDEVGSIITVNRSPEEVYRFWRDFENFPRFMGHVEDVRVLSDRRSHWQVKAPFGGTVEWDAEITEDRPNELIAWRSTDSPDVRHEGSVRFNAAPAGWGTEVRVQVRYEPPAGPIGLLGAKVATLWGREPEQEVRDDLRAFKQVIETGEVTQTEATVHGHPHPARPPERLPERAKHSSTARHHTKALQGAAA